ncbi:MAG TPA: hypothetical protein VHD95_12640 [Rhizomicrobium sp.]|jgi:hypothetical protein|nr:hypothetical protein [Rhizomicrobium sp.]
MEIKKPDAVRNAKTIYRFSFPHEVVDDPSLSLSEKRSILSRWASDACAVESFPTLRWLPGTTFPVTFSAVMDAREWLDRRTQRREDSTEKPIAPRNVVVANFARKREHRADN